MEFEDKERSGSSSTSARLVSAVFPPSSLSPLPQELPQQSSLSVSGEWAKNIEFLKQICSMVNLKKIVTRDNIAICVCVKLDRIFLKFDVI